MLGHSLGLMLFGSHIPPETHSSQHHVALLAIVQDLHTRTPQFLEGFLALPAYLLDPVLELSREQFPRVLPQEPIPLQLHTSWTNPALR